MASGAALKYEINGMRPSKEDKENREEKLDRDPKEPSLVPSDLVDEGDEEKNEETDLPPAMPPKV
jgi:hypothetical protein